MPEREQNLMCKTLLCLVIASLLFPTILVVVIVYLVYNYSHNCSTMLLNSTGWQSFNLVGNFFSNLSLSLPTREVPFCAILHHMWSQFVIELMISLVKLVIDNNYS